jgi:hypothetical protein
MNRNEGEEEIKNQKNVGDLESLVENEFEF